VTEWFIFFSEIIALFLQVGAAAPLNDVEDDDDDEEISVFKNHFGRQSSLDDASAKERLQCLEGDLLLLVL
jgi:hypothetical protein